MKRFAIGLADRLSGALLISLCRRKLRHWRAVA